MKSVTDTKLVLAQLDSRGSIQINITVPASALTLGYLLGKGSFGAVYEGLYNHKPVAIKQLSTHLTTDSLKELKREAEIMFQLGLESDYVALYRVGRPYCDLTACLKPRPSSWSCWRLSLNYHRQGWGSVNAVDADLLQSGKKIMWHTTLGEMSVKEYVN